MWSSMSPTHPIGGCGSVRRGSGCRYGICGHHTGVRRIRPSVGTHAFDILGGVHNSPQMAEIGLICHSSFIAPYTSGFTCRMKEKKWIHPVPSFPQSYSDLQNEKANWWHPKWWLCTEIRNQCVWFTSNLQEFVCAREKPNVHIFDFHFKCHLSNDSKKWNIKWELYCVSFIQDRTRRDIAFVCEFNAILLFLCVINYVLYLIAWWILH